MHIAIDTIGGEDGANLTVPAALQVLEKFPELVLTLVGDENQIGPLLSRQNLISRYRLSILDTSDATRQAMCAVENAIPELLARKVTAVI